MHRSSGRTWMCGMKFRLPQACFDAPGMFVGHIACIQDA